MADEADPRLIIRDGDTSREFPLKGLSIVSIGRSDSNLLVLSSDLVSRNHAILQVAMDGRYTLTDLGSSNGTLVNGSVIATPVFLQSGDQITIGTHELCLIAPVPKPVAAVSPDNPATTIHQKSFNLVSVLVIDLRGFTQLSHQIGASLLGDLVAVFHSGTGRIFQDEHAWSQKYIGDAVMAVWNHGKPGQADVDITRIIRGIVRAADHVATLGSSFALPSPLRIGAGVATGMASIGSFGSAAGVDRTAIGEKVNLAFRLESATRELDQEVAFCETTFHFLRAGTHPALQHFREARVSIKGYAEPQLAFLAALDDLSAVCPAMP